MIFVLIAATLLSNTSLTQPLYVDSGRATFYAKRFEGQTTASGEKFSNKKFTAAHRTLPFGTMVKVTNLDNKKSIVVRINDRGPFVKGRIIDLSRVAADSLDFIDDGWIRVKLEELPSPEEIFSEGTASDDTTIFRFPNEWFGKWKGDLKVYGQQGLVQSTPMQLMIQSTDTPGLITWNLTYADTTINNYRVVVLDSAKKLYNLDERNGVALLCTLLGNTLLTRFLVGDQIQDCEFTLRNRNELVMELHAGNYNPITQTGYAVFNNDSVPTVRVFGIGTIQVAHLHREGK